MEDVSIDEIIEVCSSITDKMIEYLQNFHCSSEEFEKEWDSECLNSSDYFNSIADVQQWQKDYLEDIGNSVSKNAHYLQIIEEEMKQQEMLTENMVKENNKMQKDIETIEENILNIKKKTEHLMNLRDQIQICKLLTNTSFTYKSSVISGYVASKQIHCFELDPEKLSKNDVTNCLYNLLKKVF